MSCISTRCKTMDEERAKQILREGTANTAEYMEAWRVAERVLGKGVRNEDVYEWASRGIRRAPE